MFLIRFVFYFTLSFAILCIPIGNGRQLFDKLYSMVTPYADKAVTTTKQKLTTTKRYSKKLYSNSEPLEKDEIKTKLAGIKRKIEIKHQTPDDAYTDEERERLRKVLTND
ncbi:MAG: hypothetical protein WC635_08760 [Bacteriovorax sp.]|jgi:hypothetical protein